jgi:hypothetical protein
MKTSDFATLYKQVAAVNGDQFTYIQDGSGNVRVSGFAAYNGNIYNPDKTFEATMFISKDNKVSFDAPIGDIWNAISYNHRLVKDGKIVDNLPDTDIAARTLVGVDANNNFYMIVRDGIEGRPYGLSLKAAAELLLSLGIIDGANLDGGGSTTVFFNNAVVNEPHDDNTDLIKERLVANHLGITNITNGGSTMEAKYNVTVESADGVRVRPDPSTSNNSTKTLVKGTKFQASELVPDRLDPTNAGKLWAHIFGGIYDGQYSAVLYNGTICTYEDVVVVPQPPTDVITMDVNATLKVNDVVYKATMTAVPFIKQ